MRAMVMRGFGGPEVFELAEIPAPELQPGHVLLRVAATSLNPIDYKIRSGLLEAIAPQTGVLGFDVAGTVEAVGEGVDRFEVGAEVFATVSGEAKAEIARSFGATPIDYRGMDVAEYVAAHTGGDGFEVVFDTVGGDNLARCFEAAALEGRVSSVNTRTTCDLSILHQKALSLHVVFMVIPVLHDQPEGRARHGDILREIATMVESGQVRPLIDERRFGFEQVGEAHALLESGEAVGKVVLNGF